MATEVIFSTMPSYAEIFSVIGRSRTASTSLVPNSLR
jgi:hypothetical protein